MALASVRAAELVSDALVSALPGPRRPELRAGEAWWAVFVGAPLLILLDNLEQVPGAADAVLSILEEYPSALVVATSQRPLSMSGERVPRLRPFPRRTSTANADADSLAADPGVALVLERAAAADVCFSPSYDDLLWIAAFCDEVGGLPLAIEIAAARAGSIPPSLMAQQLGSGHALDVLRHPVAGGEDRHAGVQDALQCSYDLLSEDARTPVRRMAVFQGSFTLESAQAVIDPGRGTGEHLDALSEAVDRGGHLPDVGHLRPCQHRPGIDRSWSTAIGDPLWRCPARQYAEGSGPPSPGWRSAACSSGRCRPRPWRRRWQRPPRQ